MSQPPTDKDTRIDRTRSNEYTQILKQLKESIVSAYDIAQRLYKQGKIDGLSNEIIRKDIETALDGVVKSRQLRNILPLELKRSYTLPLAEEFDSAIIAESNSSTQPQPEHTVGPQTEKGPPPGMPQSQSTITPSPLPSTEEPPRSPQTVKEEVEFGEWVNSLYHLTRSLAEHITGYNEDKILRISDTFQLVSETRHYRFDVAKRLPDLDLRTVHKEVRRNILLLNDFIRHLEKELDSRKNKERLISE